ncbi:MAG TPA: ABC transporter permease [Bryobacteraceae bacterium]|nr:ABC transporter permease [Bryobacteraceae bacterium]
MDLISDVRFSLRTLSKSPGFTALAITILAVGIGVNAAVFTVTNSVLFRGFPHVDPDNRILYIGTLKEGRGFGVSYPDFEDWRAQARSFRGMAVVSNGGLRMIVNDRSGPPEACDGTLLGANSFHVLAQSPILGRDFGPSDAVPGAPAVTILTYAFWQRRYAQDPSLIGRNIRLNGVPTTVIGIMPAGFDFPHHRVDLWVPLVPAADSLRREKRNLWFAFGRLADGVTIQSAQVEMDTIGSRLESAYPLTNQGVHPHLSQFDEAFIGRHAVALYGAIWGAVGFVLLIACANLANLTLARAIGRSREISVRIALGAGRMRIIRQLLTESLLLSAAGGVAGCLIALAAVRAYELLSNPPSSYNHWDFAVDARVCAYLVAISIATGVLFGLAPALRLSKLDVNAALKDGSRGVAGGIGRRGLSALLVTGEMALSIVLLAGAGLMLRSFVKIYTADLGVTKSKILTAALRLPAVRYPVAEARVAFFERLAARLKSIPGVASLSLADSLPGLYAPRLPYELAGTPPIEEQLRPTVSTVVIGPDYFRTLGATVLSGREFNDFDRASGTPVAIVNQRFASELWPAGENPLGKRLRLFDGKNPDAWRTVVGIASGIVQNDPTGQTFNPVVYVPFRQRPAADMDVLAQTGVPPGTLVSAFRREIQANDPDLVIYSGLGSIEGPKPLTESLALNNYWTEGVSAALFLIFAAIAILLAAIGMYAVIAHSVSQRTQEIGIRLAVGATAGDILKLVFLQGIFPLGMGLALGLAGSEALTRVLQSELVDVSPGDPLTLAVASTVLVLSAVLGCWIPARRAMRVDPVVALRHE